MNIIFIILLFLTEKPRIKQFVIKKNLIKYVEGGEVDIDVEECLLTPKRKTQVEETTE